MYMVFLWYFSWLLSEAGLGPVGFICLLGLPRYSTCLKTSSQNWIQDPTKSFQQTFYGLVI